MERVEQMWLAVEKEHGCLSCREASVSLTAMEWADRTMVERAICFIEDAVCDATIETGNMARLIENFKEVMGYKD